MCVGLFPHSANLRSAFLWVAKGAYCMGMRMIMWNLFLNVNYPFTVTGKKLIFSPTKHDLNQFHPCGYSLPRFAMFLLCKFFIRFVFQFRQHGNQIAVQIHGVPIAAATRELLKTPIPKHRIPTPKRKIRVRLRTRKLLKPRPTKGRQFSEPQAIHLPVQPRKNNR